MKLVEPSNFHQPFIYISRFDCGNEPHHPGTWKERIATIKFNNKKEENEHDALKFDRFTMRMFTYERSQHQTSGKC